MSVDCRTPLHSADPWFAAFSDDDFEELDPGRRTVHAVWEVVSELTEVFDRVGAMISTISDPRSITG